MTETKISASREKILETLNSAFADRFHSMAAYILQSSSFVEKGRESEQKIIERIAASDAEIALRLADVIEELDGIPQVPAYNHRLAELNYLSLDFVKNELRSELSRQLERCENALPFLEGCAAARNAIYFAAETLRRHIEDLA
jgi:bacterioferritin (cytochrome b1)